MLGVLGVLVVLFRFPGGPLLPPESDASCLLPDSPYRGTTTLVLVESNAACAFDLTAGSSTVARGAEASMI
jgi:hypothetical protein